jgi:hypothetical protein
MIGKFFHTPATKKFNLTPRFWDPDKKEREEREQRIREELGIPKEKEESSKPYKSNIKGQFRQAQGGLSRSSEKERRASNTRLIILIMIFALIVYLFFYSDIIFR